MSDAKIKVGELYRKYQGIGSSCNTFALVTGSAYDKIEYEIYSDSPLIMNSNIRTSTNEKEFLEYYSKIPIDTQNFPDV